MHYSVGVSAADPGFDFYGGLNQNGVGSRGPPKGPGGGPGGRAPLAGGPGAEPPGGLGF